MARKRRRACRGAKRACARARRVMKKCAHVKGRRKRGACMRNAWKRV